jgi:hypothetical protein
VLLATGLLRAVRRRSLGDLLALSLWTVHFGGTLLLLRALDYIVHSRYFLFETLASALLVASGFEAWEAFLARILTGRRRGRAAALLLLAPGLWAVAAGPLASTLRGEKDRYHAVADLATALRDRAGQPIRLVCHRSYKKDLVALLLAQSGKSPEGIGLDGLGLRDTAPEALAEAVDRRSDAMASWDFLVLEHAVLPDATRQALGRRVHLREVEDGLFMACRSDAPDAVAALDAVLATPRPRVPVVLLP